MTLFKLKSVIMPPFPIPLPSSLPASPSLAEICRAEEHVPCSIPCPICDLRDFGDLAACRFRGPPPQCPCAASCLCRCKCMQCNVPCPAVYWRLQTVEFCPSVCIRAQIMTKVFPGPIACVLIRRTAPDGSKPTCSTKWPHTCICIGISMRKSLTIATHAHGPETVSCHLPPATLMGADPLVTADAGEATNETRNAVQGSRQLRVMVSLDHWIIGSLDRWIVGGRREFIRGSVSQTCAKQQKVLVDTGVSNSNQQSTNDYL